MIKSASFWCVKLQVGDKPRYLGPKGDHVCTQSYDAVESRNLYFDEKSAEKVVQAAHDENRLLPVGAITVVPLVLTDDLKLVGVATTKNSVTK